MRPGPMAAQPARDRVPGHRHRDPAARRGAQAAGHLTPADVHPRPRPVADAEGHGLVPWHATLARRRLLSSPLSIATGRGATGPVGSEARHAVRTTRSTGPT